MRILILLLLVGSVSSASILEDRKPLSIKNSRGLIVLVNGLIKKIDTLQSSVDAFAKREQFIRDQIHSSEVCNDQCMNSYPYVENENKNIGIERRNCFDYCNKLRPPGTGGSC